MSVDRSLLDPATREVVDRYLEALCRELGAQPAHLDDAGEAAMSGVYQGREVTIGVTLESRHRVLLIRAPVGRLADGERAAATQALLLGLNLSPADTGGASFAVSPADGSVYLVHCLVGERLHYDLFRSAFLRIFAVASAWQQQFATHPALRPSGG